MFQSSLNKLVDILNKFYKYKKKIIIKEILDTYKLNIL